MANDTIQAFLFPIDSWTLEQAKNYLDRLGIVYLKIHKTKNYYRFRIRKPDQTANYHIENFTYKISRNPLKYKIYKVVKMITK